MRILFAGSPGIAVPVLEKLFALSQSSQGTELPIEFATSIELAGILTNPDTAKGRSSALQPTDIAAAAERLSYTGCAPLLFKPEKLDAAARERIEALKPELLVSFAYGRIFGPKFLGLFPLGGINIHPSLLPKYRGPTPIPAAILAREKETGITIQRLAPEMDSGDILLQERVTLAGNETTASLGNCMAARAAELLPRVLEGIASGTLQARPQNHDEASYCSLITKEEGRINWNKSAVEIDAQIRAYDPWPLCWTHHGDQQLFILKAHVAQTSESGIPCPQTPPVPGMVLGIDKQGILVQTGEGVLAAVELQYRSKKALQWKNFLNGARNFIGCRLGQLIEVQ